MTDNESSNKLIKRFRTEYTAALAGIESHVSELIKNSKEMRALFTMNEYLAKILGIHEQISNLYIVIVKGQAIIKKYGSIRLQQLGHELVLTMKLIEDTSISEDEKETYILNEMRKLGYNHKHWFIKERLLVEIDYMLDVLDILVEPDFMPITEPSDSEGNIDRHIPSDVKIGVWRRDSGKCTKCGSREKLEYDHIIPVSKGGSNTERNVQLLCEKCNREKTANIQ